MVNMPTIKVTWPLVWRIKVKVQHYQDGLHSAIVARVVVLVFIDCTSRFRVIRAALGPGTLNDSRGRRIEDGSRLRTLPSATGWGDGRFRALQAPATPMWSTGHQTIHHTFRKSGFFRAAARKYRKARVLCPAYCSIPSPSITYCQGHGGGRATA
ncbi:hypothetical protein BC834DRAFT_100308 [Gloeopeniophorella convolvens]|nr:hypothetical protein BC834DRAFT_100308 [Gloeopeniophorella convolvens]